jgi:hypothetical protein
MWRRLHISGRTHALGQRPRHELQSRNLKPHPGPPLKPHPDPPPDPPLKGRVCIDILATSNGLSAVARGYAFYKFKDVNELLPSVWSVKDARGWLPQVRKR